MPLPTPLLVWCTQRRAPPSAQALAGLRKMPDFNTIMSCDSIQDLFRTATAGLAPVGALTDWLE
ncbi:MAG TPA: hypothetical protein VF278_07010 [Pirellulales bacterium]